MTNKKRYARKVLSLALAALMCLSVCLLDWSGFVPTASANLATGSHTFRFYLNLYDNDGDLWINCSTSNGGSWSPSGGGSDGQTSGQWSSTTWPANFSWSAGSKNPSFGWNLYLQVYNGRNSSWDSIASASWSDTRGKDGTDDRHVSNSGTPGTSGSPYLYDCGASGGTTLTAPNYGSAAASYGVSCWAVDQYNVSYPASVSWSKPTDNYGGCSLSASDGSGTLTVPAATGQTDGKTVTVRASIGGNNRDTTFTINTNDYYIDLNGKLDGTDSGSISGYGKANVVVNGTTVASNVEDYYTAWPSGTLFSVTNAGANTGYTYVSGNVSNARLGGGTYDARLVYRINTSTLSVNPGSGTWSGSTNAQSFTQNYNTTKSITLPTKDGWEFTGWSQSSPFYGSFTGSTTGNSSYTYPANDGVTSTITACWKRDITNTYRYYDASFAPKTVTKSATAYNTATTLSIDTPAASEVTGEFTRNDKTWTLKGWAANTTASDTWGPATQNAAVGIGTTTSVSTGSSAYTYYPVYALKNTKFYANYNYLSDNAVAGSQQRDVTVDGDATTGAMPVPAVTEDGAGGTIPQYYTANGIVYELQGWSTTAGATSAEFAYDAATATLNVPGAGSPTSTANLTPVELYPVYSVYATAIHVHFNYYTDGGAETFLDVSGRALGEDPSGDVKFPDASNVTTSYTKDGRTYTLVGWNAVENSEAGDTFNTTVTLNKLSDPANDFYTYYPVYTTTTSIKYHYTTAANNVTTDNYAVKSTDNFGGTSANINAKYVDIAVPVDADLSSLTYKKDGLTWKIVGWATTENAAAATYTINQTTPVNVKVTDDGAAYDYYPVYELYKKDVVSQYWYYDAAGTYTHFDVTDPDKAAADTSATVTMTAAANVVTSYTTGGITYTLLGWQQDPASTDYHAFGASDTVALEADAVTTIHFYPVYSATTTAKYYYFGSSGTQASMIRTSDTLKADNTVPTEIGVAVPTSGFNKTVTLDGRTFTFCGWRLDTVSAAETVASTVTSETHTIRDEVYNYYAIYRNDTLTLTYNGINGEPIPDPQVKSQHINAGTGNANINNAEAVEFPVNPNSVKPEKDGYTCIGWQDNNNAETETATYAFTGGSLTTKVNKTIYAVYSINDMTVKFTYWSGNGYATDTTTIKYDDGTRSDTGAPRYKTTGRSLDTAPIDHADQTNHYYFTGWAIESGTATLTENVDDTRKSATISLATTDVNVQAKYQGVSHHWVTVIDEDHPYVDATCTTDGYFYHYCSDCGYEDYHARIPATGHEMAFEGYKAPTCTADGKYAISVCSRCGLKSTDDGYGAAKYYDYEDGNYVAVDATERTIPMLGHDWEIDTTVGDNGVVAPTCTSRGYTAYVCKNNSGHVKYDNYVDASGHTPVTGEAKDPTCTEAGYTAEVKCSVCGAVVQASSVIPAKGHTLVIDVAVAPTCTEDGLTEGRHCSVCGTITVPQEVVIAPGHDFVQTPAEPATCTRPGHTAGSVCSRCGEVEPGQTDVTVIPALDHDFTGAGVHTESDEPCKTPGYTTYTCLNGCGETHVVYDDPADHTPEDVPAKPATCTEEGYEAYTKCSVCGEPLTEKVIIPKTSHQWTVDEAAVAATCTAAGHTASYKCENCDATIAATEIAKLGHSFGRWIVTKTATCTEAGEEARVCARCNEEETRVLPQLEHDFQPVAEVPATCVKAGTTAGSKCTKCGEIETGCETIPATGEHTFGDYTTVKEATCTSVGAKKHTCSVCGLTETDVIEKIDHTFETLAAEEPTCTAIGHTAGKRCTVCGYKEGYEAIAKKQHTEETVGAVEATCTAAGSTGKVQCSVCGTVIAEAREIPAKGHTMGNWSLVKAPTCTETGSRERVCSVCGENKETMTLDALGHDMTPVAEKAATCGVAGHIAYYKCSRCAGKYFVDEAGTAEYEEAALVIQALEHSWGNASTIEATCTAGGYTLETCGNCGETRKVNETPANGHRGGTATCKDRAVCEVCGVPYGGYADHNYSVEVIPGTCVENGKKIKTCTVCGDVVEITQAKGDHQVERHIITAPTCTDTGYYKDICTICDTVVSEGTLPKTSHTDADGDGICDDCGATLNTPSGATGTCDKCGRNHAGEQGGIFGYDGFVCKIIAFARKIIKMFSK